MLWVVWCVAFVVWAVCCWRAGRAMDDGDVRAYRVWWLPALVSSLTMVGVSVALIGWQI